MTCIPSDAALRHFALSLGFDDVGITPATLAAEDVEAWRRWLAKGYHGALSYMESELRSDPQKLWPKARTAVLFVSYYKQAQQHFDGPTRGLVASYARGRDYHNVHRRRCQKVIRWLEETTGQQDIALAFSDSKPLLEKALAIKAGLGWMGKNTLMIHRRFGTFFLLSGLLTSLELPAPPPLSTRQERCGVCRRCLDACPTGALVNPYELDARRCLSYHLIESKDAIPPAIADKNPGYIFGCDICQDVCPHNARKPLSTAEAFSPEAGVGAYLAYEDIVRFSENPTLLHGSPLNRRGAIGLRDNYEKLAFPRTNS